MYPLYQRMWQRNVCSSQQEIPKQRWFPLRSRFYNSVATGEKQGTEEANYENGQENNAWTRNTVGTSGDRLRRRATANCDVSATSNSSTSNAHAHGDACTNSNA
jgi:hypothetical protein